jgi:glycosyltransferase involved in cell wall biosynthesis
MKPKISVIIPAYNSGSFLAEAIESALSQTYRSIEIICIDDGSTDNTRDVALSFGSKVKYVYQDNRGVSAARNAGIRLSQGRFIAFLDSDDKWDSRKLEKQAALFSQNPKFGLVHSDVYYWGPGQDQKTMSQRERQVIDGDCYLRLFFSNPVITSTVLIRKECIDFVGPFDETLSVSEDWDLWIRISRYFRLAYISEPLVAYRLHEGSLTTNSIKMRQGDLFVVERTLKNDPALKFRLGPSRVRKMVFKLSFGVGYHYFSDNELHLARHYLKKAILNRPRSLVPITYYLATFMPSKTVAKIRALKTMVIQRAVVTRRGYQVE